MTHENQKVVCKRGSQAVIAWRFVDSESNISETTHWHIPLQLKLKASKINLGHLFWTVSVEYNIIPYMFQSYKRNDPFWGTQISRNCEQNGQVACGLDLHGESLVFEVMSYLTHVSSNIKVSISRKPTKLQQKGPILIGV